MSDLVKMVPGPGGMLYAELEKAEQERDEKGRFGSGSGGASGQAKDHEGKAALHEKNADNASDKDRAGQHHIAANLHSQAAASFRAAQAHHEAGHDDKAKAAFHQGEVQAKMANSVSSRVYSAKH